MSAQKQDPFVHLHTHFDSGSLLDGLGTAKEYVAAAVKHNQPAIAITDHGTLAGVHQLYSAVKDAQKEGHEIHAIAGLEAYFVPSIGTIDSKEPLFLGDGSRDDVSSRGAYTHLTLLAENAAGLRNLFRMSKIASLRGFYKKPRISLEVLAEHAEGIIVTTGCPSSEVQTELRLGHYDKALAFAAKLVDIVGKDNVFVELMDHGMKQDLERKVRGELLRIAMELDLPIVATNDTHYATHEQAKTHEELLAIQTRAKMSEAPDYDGGTRFAFEGGGSYYVKSAAEMAQVFPDMPEALSNTLLIAERAKLEVKYDDVTLRPTIPVPEGHDQDSWLRKECYEGLAKRLPDKVNDEVYIARMEKELKVLKDKNFSSYFLVVSDMIRWAKFRAEPKIYMGPGRGSAAGSLVAFVLDITDADPIRFDLLFERFLNPERDSPPDVDIDIADRDRPRLIDYVIETYGEDQVAQVITYGTIGAKAAIKDVARIYEYPIPTSDALSKALPPPIFGKEIHLSDVYNPDSARYPEAEEFRDLVKREHLEEIIEPSLKLEGRVRSHGKHAAAVIISNKNLADVIPIAVLKAGERPVAMWDYPTAEAMGLIKMDFLGLRNLSIMQDAIASIKRTKGVELDLPTLILGAMDDAKTYQMLQRGDSLGVFQLDGSGMRSLMKMLKPNDIEDISALVALYRPGPMGVNAHTDYALRKNGLQEVTPIHPEFAESLKETLEPTYGIILYQEQIQRMAQIIAGYTLAEADLLRRAMGKKKRYIIDAEFANFKPRAMANGYSEEAIQTLWDVVVPFADYAFNKAHSLAYALTAYATAYLKANYPTEYMAALLTSTSGNKDKTAEYLEDCRQHDIIVRQPDVNLSGVDYTPVRDNEIVFGFKAIKGVGDKPSQDLVTWREENGEFKSFEDYLMRAPKTALNKTVIMALAESGGFDSFKITRRSILEQIESLVKALQKLNLKRKKHGDGLSLFDNFDELELTAREKTAMDALAEQIKVLPMQEYPKMEKLKIERERLGLYVSDHPLKGVDLAGLSNAKVSDLLPVRIDAAEEGEEDAFEPPIIRPVEGWPGPKTPKHQIAGILSSWSSRTSKKGNKFGMGLVEDHTGSQIEITMFGKAFDTYGEFMKADQIYQFTGYSRYGMNGEDINFNVEAIRPLEFSDSGLMNVRIRLLERQFARAQKMFEQILTKYPPRVEDNGEVRSANIVVSLKDADTNEVREVTLDTVVEPGVALMQEIKGIFGRDIVGRWKKPTAAPAFDTYEPETALAPPF